MGQAKARGSFDDRKAQALGRAAEQEQQARLLAEQRRQAENAERVAVAQAKREGRPIPKTPMLDMRARVNRSKLMLALAETMAMQSKGN